MIFNFQKKQTHELLFVINDVCNSHCKMCGIWHSENRSELSIAEIRDIFSDARLRSIEHVRLTGGEPTLRKDLPEISQILVASLPRLRKITLETNAIELDHVWTIVNTLHQSVRTSGKIFSVDVALDGIGSVHDTQRGVPGNFASAVALLDKLKSSAIPFTVQSTLTSFNCEQADDLLLWLDENKIKEFHFRLGGESDHYHTNGYFQRQPFSEEQKFHMAGFFDNLSRRNRKLLHESYYYRTLAEQISKGPPPVGDRTSHGMIINYDGNLLHSLKLEGDSLVQEFSAQMPRQEILKRTKLRMSSIWRKQWGGIAKRFDRLVPTASSEVKGRQTADKWQTVLITGWYGTETTGDKAILGEIIHCLKSYNPNMQFVITTIDEKVSRQTNRELGLLNQVELIPIEHAHRFHVIHNIDAVIMGGGPLMDTVQLEYVRKIFVQANKHQIARIIFGCGVGPIRAERTRLLISDICRLASAGFYRDEKSYSSALELGGNPSLTWACDPSLGFLARWRKKQVPSSISHISLHLTGLFREQTKEYYPSPDLSEKNLWFARQIADTFEKLQGGFSAVEYNLLPMHMYWKGNDDRIFNRRIARECASDLPINVVREYLPIGKLLEGLSRADVAIPMRYHGHLFSLALGIPFLSVNYTNTNGKVGNLLESIGYQDFVEDFETFNSDRACRKVEKIFSQRREIRTQLLFHTDQLVERLNQAYRKTFGVVS